MPDPIWRVVVARGIEPADKLALAQVGATYISGHSGPGLTSSSILVRAGTEEDAREAITRALGDPAFIREARELPVFVYAPITADSRPLFENAAAEDDRVGGVIEEEGTGRLEVCFALPLASIDTVFNQARGLYARICSDGGQPTPTPLELRMGGFEALLGDTARDRLLLGKAAELLDAGEWALVVVVAQTACEVLIADTIRSLLQPHTSDLIRPWLFGRVRSFTLKDDPTRALFDNLTGSEIKQQAFWPEYVKHVDRRHRIVHAGEPTDEPEARASLLVAEALFDYVEQVAAAVPPHR